MYYELPLKLLAVFGLAMIELWAAVPAGLAMSLSPVAVGITTALGAIAGILAVVLLGKRVQGWLARHGRGGVLNPKGRFYQVWHRYGVIGLGLLAPLITGAPLGAALGLALGAPARRLLLWMSVGAALWSALLTAAGALGMTLLVLLR